MNGDAIAGIVTITVTSTDPESGVNFVAFSIDDNYFGSDYTASNNQYSISLNTQNYNDGYHILKASAVNSQGLFTIKTITIKIDNINIDITGFNLDGYNPITGNYEVNKGEKVAVFLKIKNTGSVIVQLTSITFKCKSILANNLGVPYTNDNGPIVLESTHQIIASSINQGAILIYDFEIEPIGYSNGAMNIGEWRISEIIISESNGEKFNFIPLVNDATYHVIPKDKTNGPHAVFIYYLWNSGGTGENFGDDNPRKYFENGYGDVKAGFYVFKDPSIVPVTFNFIIGWDEDSWEIADGLVNELTINELGRNCAASKLNIQKWTLSSSALSKTFSKNCGFDLLIMGAARAHDTMGITVGKNTYSFFKAGASTNPNRWKENIDGTVQHQLVCLFSGYVCHPETGPNHPKIECVNAWGTLLHPYDYLHEYNLAGYNNKATNNICDDCDKCINYYWNWFYTIE